MLRKSDMSATQRSVPHIVTVPHDQTQRSSTAVVVAAVVILAFAVLLLRIRALEELLERRE